MDKKLNMRAVLENNRKVFSYAYRYGEYSDAQNVIISRAISSLDFILNNEGEFFTNPECVSAFRDIIAAHLIVTLSDNESVEMLLKQTNNANVTTYDEGINEYFEDETPDFYENMWRLVGDIFDEGRKANGEEKLNLDEDELFD